MRKFGQKISRLLGRDTRGSEIAETAAVLPLLFMILMGIYWFGQAYRMYGTATSAARAGARAAVAPACTTCTALTPAQIDANVQTAVQNALVAANLNPNQLVATSKWTRPVPQLCACTPNNPNTTCANPVTCDAAVTNICVQENVQLSDITGGMGVCGTSVSLRYQYPYHFGVPLTNMDLGNLQLPGQAQMRLETQ
ncbi:MAG: TadE family protein [Candidatus Sulfotelmatobacter sp.]